MFTVLHRHDTGTETLYNATVVSREPDGGGPIEPRNPSNVILRGVPRGQQHGPGATRPTDDMIVLKAGNRSGDKSKGWTPAVFVMNAAGATVARYYL